MVPAPITAMEAIVWGVPSFNLLLESPDGELRGLRKPLVRLLKYQ